MWTPSPTFTNTSEIFKKTTCQSVCTCRKGQKFQTADNAVRTYDTSQIGILNLYLPPNNDGVCISDGITKP
ncbi:hypothetical protein CIJ83_01975 [Neisseria meningitidis]|uniref:Uncharacterized protein n=2 Tax=Neisseria meningitidis TaxID=487 RepID=X5ELL9_NEIME|nr:hypothetical protein NMA510612_2329 [Neisseria meningitidis]EFV63886.1 hypothetical protein NMH_0667 [Neisseria meningitidis H44/76]ARC08996.1 hypothetical protein A6J49_10530 [Neisseria meningitidis]ARC13383.1 hypothetical protein A6J51_06140 [Neisseria meningitidis]MBG8577999.1 hypothetical protein [Neisseria meningitidis]